jgi:chromosome segregation ATPase
MDGATGSAQTFLTPPRILIPKLVLSRDGWKDKANQRKKKLKAARIRIRDLEASRDHWKQKTTDAQKRIAELEQQFAQTQQDLAAARDETEALKKK